METKLLIYISCFLSLAVSCPIGWKPYKTSCYHVSTEDESWIDAMKMCQFHGAYLAHITEPGENDFVVSVMQQTHSSSFWIGGSDWTIEGTWVWEPLGVKMNYTNFSPGKPNNYNGENCLSIRNYDHKWDDDDCDEQRRYICERSQSLTNVFG
ncbi:perlucin-like protein [Crassostrea virginica]|uniref:Perlucin-like protein n=1 Tax=Crassostrea virginica TaxID=6565 RepID=A0A8B8DZI8_CRAVI|nr:perlucin-like protein [Crassostrea virginica]XP_022333991.1 perlucin-like protein [Crassostrea virginica]